MEWIALPNLRALYAGYVDIESSRGAGTNLDRTKKGEIDLHGPSAPKEQGVGRADPKRRRVYRSVNEIRSYTPQERIGQAVDSHEDRPP
jgi:hypothetical protein